MNSNKNNNNNNNNILQNYKSSPLKRGMRNFKKRASLFLSAIILTCSILFGTNALINSNNNSDIPSVSSAPANTTLSVTFLDVGQGNCVIAESNGHYMLIDGGNSDYSSLVVSYLRDLGVTTLDYVLISHYDADHLSGIIGVLNNFNVTKVISPDYESDTKTYNSYLSVMTKKSYIAIHPSIGDQFDLGNSSFQIVSPIKYTYEDENNNSIGIKLNDGFHSFLLLGDAHSESESDILNTGIDLSSDVYMVSHHGSSSSSSKELLNAINPSIAVISVGENDYGHPTEKTLARLNTQNINILRTDQDGTIIAYSGKDFLKWNINFDTKSIKKESGTTAIALTYIGNKKSLIFHVPTCPNLPYPSNQISFNTREDAINSDFNPCGVCNP